MGKLCQYMDMVTYVYVRMYMRVSQAWKGNWSQVRSIHDTRECCISHSVHNTVELTDQGEQCCSALEVRRMVTGAWTAKDARSEAERSQWLETQKAKKPCSY